MSKEQQPLSWIQRVMIKILPRSWAEDMEMHSRLWVLHCDKCGFEESFWDIGGIRWRAYGNQRTLWRCKGCGRASWHQAIKRPG